MMYVSQMIMLYTLNLDSAVCQLSLSKTGTKNPITSDKLCLPFRIQFLQEVFVKQIIVYTGINIQNDNFLM